MNPQTTLKDLIAIIESRFDLPPLRRRELVSSVNSLARWLGTTPADIPASVSWLRKGIRDLHHGSIGVSKGRFANAVSAVRKALEIGGVVSPLGKNIEALSPAWRSLYDQLPDKYARVGLSRFMRFCSLHGIDPNSVSDAVSGRFHQILDQEMLGKSPRTTHQTACRLWNKMAEEIPGWPQIRLSVPRYETRIYAVDPGLLPKSTNEEIEAYVATLAGSDPFRGPRPYRPTSLKAVRSHLRAYISALHHGGVDLARIETLRELVSSTNFELAMRWHWERAGKKATRHIGEIAWTIRNIAVKHLKLGDDAAVYFKKKLAHFEMQQHGLSDKNRRSLSQFENSEAVQRYLRAPDTLWAKAGKRDGHEASRLAQAAVAIDILIHAPMRIENLNTLRFDQHLAWRGERLHIHIPADQVKNNRNLESLLPPSVSRRVRKYIDKYRGVLCEGLNTYLFPGRHGKPKDRSCFARQIKAAVLDAAGIRLTPHQFRHAAAKILLDRRPGHYELVRQVLGHTSTSTVYESYSGTETQAAHDLYDQVVLDAKLGADLDPRHRSSRNRKTPPDSASPAKAFDPLLTPLRLTRPRAGSRHQG